MYLLFLVICASQPCSNGGVCVGYNNNANYYCQCPPEYTGSTCSKYFVIRKRKEQDRRISFIFIKATPLTVCPADFCKNNGQCTFDYTLNRLRCACPATFSGKYCEIPIGNNTKK